MSTYKEQRDKIIEAYFRDEIKPYEERFCFCGTLANNNDTWNWRHTENLEYSFREFKKMEAALLDGIHEGVGEHRWSDINYWHRNGGVPWDIPSRPNYEDSLFKGMCAALDVLKQIHINRGEDVDEVPAFEKRKLNRIVGVQVSDTTKV